jgi:DNA polymerase-3 subunit alpha
MIDFLEKNLKDFPGKAGLRLVVAEPKNNLKISLVTLDSGLEMNADLITYLDEKPEIDVKVVCA